MHHLGWIVDEHVAGGKLEPVGLPLAEARLAEVLDDALALDGRLELKYRIGRHSHTVQRRQLLLFVLLLLLVLWLFLWLLLLLLLLLLLRMCETGVDVVQAHASLLFETVREIAAA